MKVQKTKLVRRSITLPKTMADAADARVERLKQIEALKPIDMRLLPEVTVKLTFPGKFIRACAIKHNNGDVHAYVMAAMEAQIETDMQVIEHEAAERMIREWAKKECGKTPKGKAAK